MPKKVESKTTKKTKKTLKAVEVMEKIEEKETPVAEVLEDTVEQYPKEEKSVPKKKGEIFYGTGRRKTSVASVWMKMEKGDLLINEKPIKEYFTKAAEEKIYEEPFRVVNRLGQFSATIKVSGGGISSQLGAVVHGLSRALASVDQSYQEILSKKKLLTRDSRMKERRKYGHAGKARKMKQSPKR